MSTAKESRTTDLQEVGSALAAFPDELEHLQWIRRRLRLALEESADAIEKVRGDYMDARRYQAQYRHEIDPKELFVNELLLGDVVDMGRFEVKYRDKLAKLEDSPYFARIDFCADGDAAPDAFYIGRFHFDENGSIHIYDWRAPISSMFYDYELGKSAYRAPSGPVGGELTRKRQFRIEGGRMVYALESAVNIQDDVLQRELSSTSDERMKTIIATIQKEQNQIIRDESAEVMVIQGVAGSGKTSIALHRVAFLMYRQQGRLTAANVAIISPNRVFGDYISGVLPELGEEPIIELSFPLIAAIQLDGVVAFEPERDPVEAHDPAWGERVRLKSSPEFLLRLEEYMEQAAIACFQPTGYAYGRWSVSAEWIMERYLAYGRHPVKRRIREVAGDMRDRFESDNPMEDTLPSAKAIEKKLLAMLTAKSTMALYRDFYRRSGLAEQLVLPAKNTLEWADVYPFLYVHAGFEGLRENRSIRHLVVDEMQDYTAVQYMVLNRLFQCKKTILGDLGQSVNPYHMPTYDTFYAAYANLKIVELNTSYRSSYEIIRFAGRILPLENLRPVERHGEEPRWVACESREEEVESLQGLIEAFRSGGSSSLGIITKTFAQATALWKALCARSVDVHRITPESERYEGGVTICSVRMSKGLEFDEVIVPFADSETFHTAHDRNLLYVACTRAMHKLTLQYSGARTPLYAER